MNLVLGDLIEKLEALPANSAEVVHRVIERINELEQEQEKFVETIVALEFEHNKKTNGMIKRHADRIEELKRENLSLKQQLGLLPAPAESEDD